jgi:hypothetical protein
MHLVQNKLAYLWTVLRTLHFTNWTMVLLDEKIQNLYTVEYWFCRVVVMWSSGSVE